MHADTPRSLTPDHARRTAVLVAACGLCAACGLASEQAPGAALGAVVAAGDGGVSDVAGSDVGSDVGDAVDTGARPADEADGGALDVSPPDTNAPDTNAPDTGQPDTAAADTGPPCGGACAAGEICVSGKCKNPKCTLPPLPNGPDVNKISRLGLRPEGVGCDLDKDGQPDNVYGKIVGIYAAANDAIQDDIDSGDLVLFLSPEPWKSDGAPFAIDLLMGDIDPPSAGCDPTVAGDCKYRVSKGSYAYSWSPGLCPPVARFTPATVLGGQLFAGGTKQVFFVDVPLIGINLNTKITSARIVGEVGTSPGFKGLVDGSICGVVLVADLEKSIDSLPPNVLAATGFGPATLKSLILGVLKPDQDTDADGKPDAISIALRVDSFPAGVVGWVQ